MIKATLRGFYRLFWTMLVVMLVLVASYVSLGRYYIEYVDDYQQQLLAKFIDISGLPITVASLSGQWAQLSPVFTMGQMILLDPNGNNPVLTIESASFQVDPFKSLINRVLHIKHLQVSGLKSSLVENDQGRWQLKDYPLGSSQQPLGFEKIIELLLAVDGAKFIGADLSLLPNQGEASQLTVHELSLRHDSGFRRLRLLVNFDDTGNPVTGIIETRGDPRQSNKFSAKGYLKLDEVDFSAQLPALRSLGIDLTDAQVDGELWLDWQPDMNVSAQGHVSAPVLDIAALSGEPLEPLEKVELSFRVEKAVSDQWYIWLPQLNLQWRQQAFSFQQLTLALSQNSARLSLPTLSLNQAVEQLLSIELLPDSGSDTLKTLAPNGSLSNVHINLARQNSPVGSQVAQQADIAKQPLFNLIANLSDVGIQSWKGAPGATGINGYLEVTPTTGLVELDSQQFSLDFPVVYQHSLEFESGRGQVAWEINQQRVLVKSGPLYLQAEYGPASGLLSLDLPIKSNSGDPLMTLVIGIRNTDARYRNLLIPYTLNEGFLDWMAGSVPEGQVIDGGFIYRGSLISSAAIDRTVQLYFNVEKTVLDYHPDWPPLEDIIGMVVIDDATVDVKTDRARLFHLEIPSAHVQVAPLQGQGLWLTVDATATGSSHDALRVVNESYIRSVVGDVFKDWRLDGAAAATVKLGVPLVDITAAPEIDVVVDLNNSTLQIPEYRLEFGNLQGELSYSSGAGIASDGIQANLYHKPVTASVSQSAAGDVTVDMSGRLSITDLANWTPQAAFTFLSGDTDFDARIFVPAKATPVTTSANGADQIATSEHADTAESTFSVSSSLQGITIDLPSPYKKMADEKQPFWLNLPLSGDKGLLLAMGIDKTAELQLALDQGAVKSGLVLLGEADYSAHEPGAITVVGQVPTFDFDNWKRVLDRYLVAAEELAIVQQDPVADEGEEQSSLSVIVRDLMLAEFKGFNQDFEQSLVNLKKTPAGWWVSADNSVLTIELIVSDDTEAPLLAHFLKLNVPLETTLNGDDGANEGLADIDLGQFDQFAANISIADLSIGGEHYGQLSFQMRGGENSLAFKHLSAAIRGVKIGYQKPAELLWQRTDEGDYSQFYGGYTFQDIGKTLDSWHYEKMIESKSGRGFIDLSWPGAPDQWQLKNSQGSISLKVNEGRFVKTSEAAAGTLKVVGIVNFANIIRRLQLDFSDLYERGVSFDTIDGQLQLHDGDLKIVDDLVVKAPSSRFHLKGGADMVEQQLDMELIATLPIANNLPWIAALAGGLPTAAGVYVASKIFESQMDRLSSAVYTVEGDWNNPELAFKRVFDDTKKRSKKSTKKKPAKAKRELETEPTLKSVPEVPTKENLASPNANQSETKQSQTFKFPKSNSRATPTPDNDPLQPAINLNDATDPASLDPRLPGQPSLPKASVP